MDNHLIRLLQLSMLNPPDAAFGRSCRPEFNILLGLVYEAVDRIHSHLTVTLPSPPSKRLLV
jgi:hypothetical protein